MRGGPSTAGRQSMARSLPPGLGRPPQTVSSSNSFKFVSYSEPGLLSSVQAHGQWMRAEPAGGPDMRSGVPMPVTVPQVSNRLGSSHWQWAQAKKTDSNLKAAETVTVHQTTAARSRMTATVRLLVGLGMKVISLLLLLVLKKFARTQARSQYRKSLLSSCARLDPEEPAHSVPDLDSEIRRCLSARRCAGDLRLPA